MTIDRRHFLSLNALALPGLAAGAAGLSPLSTDPVQQALAGWATRQRDVTTQGPLFPGMPYAVTVQHPEQLAELMPSLSESFEGDTQADGDVLRMRHGSRSFDVRVRVASLS